MKHGNREQFRFWFCKQDTLTTEKSIELKAFLSLAESLHLFIVLFEVEPKSSVVTRSPAGHNLECYNTKDKNMNPDEDGRVMLLSLCKESDYKQTLKPNGLDEMQLYEVLLHGGKVIIVSFYRSPLSCSGSSNKLMFSLIKSVDSRTRYNVFGDRKNGDINWQSKTTNHDEDIEKHTFPEAVKDSYLDQHVEKPTREVKHNKTSPLELVLNDSTL